jgi:hypothetical protein
MTTLPKRNSTCNDLDLCEIMLNLQMETNNEGLLLKVLFAFRQALSYPQ